MSWERWVVWRLVKGQFIFCQSCISAVFFLNEDPFKRIFVFRDSFNSVFRDGSKTESRLVLGHFLMISSCPKYAQLLNGNCCNLCLRNRNKPVTFLPQLLQCLVAIKALNLNIYFSSCFQKQLRASNLNIVNQVVRQYHIELLWIRGYQRWQRNGIWICSNRIMFGWNYDM